MAEVASECHVQRVPRYISGISKRYRLHQFARNQIFFFPSYFVFQAQCYSGDQMQNVLRLDEPSIAAEIWVTFCSGKCRSVCICAGKEEK